ncbi:amidase [Herbaspirillum sp.]|uniref:amidase n=1 Tax=Herbaspirillum sp. TaxID=1890675 RepID=UPI001B23BCA9|nr:amidase [Herbaspirillum sp.]MBO9535353.1 amidase [Herbaspirillum sp.]
MTPLWQFGATQLAAGFAAGAFTPVEALQSCLARCQDINPALNALIFTDAEGAMQAAAGSGERWRAGRPASPLDGVPVTIKDNLHVQGWPTQWGSRALAGLVAKRDELPVARLREAGLVLFGKTNVPEFTMQGYTDNLVFGPTRNPWNLDLTPGGSSGGAAALVAAGGCPLALGTDGGGSIRRPASHTNTVGFKPSRGRVPRSGGLPPIFLEFEVAAPLARNVEDVSALMRIIGGEAPADLASGPYRILHIPQFGEHPVDPAIAALTERAAGHFAGLGHRVVRASAFDLAEEVNRLWPLLSQIGLAWLAAHPQELAQPAFDTALFGPAMQANLEAGRQLSAQSLFDLLLEIGRLKNRLSALFEDYDFLLTPAAAALPWPATQTHPHTIGGREAGPRGHAVFAAFANAAGLPAIALPCGFAQGLPVGLQLLAQEGRDEALLALAGRYQQAHSWASFPIWQGTT